MLLKCIRKFTTRESGFPFTLAEGTVWYKATYEYALGGYEIAVLEKVAGGAFTGVMARVRAERIGECFESIPFMECPEPVSELTGNDDASVGG